MQFNKFIKTFLLWIKFCVFPRNKIIVNLYFSINYIILAFRYHHFITKWKNKYQIRRWFFILFKYQLFKTKNKIFSFLGYKYNTFLRIHETLIFLGVDDVYKRKLFYKDVFKQKEYFVVVAIVYSWISKQNRIFP